MGFCLAIAYVSLNIYIYIYDCWKKSILSKWLPPWRKGRITCLWIKSVFDCLTIGIIHETIVVQMTWVWTFFNNYSNHPRMCVLSPLCGNVDKHSPFDIYIYFFLKCEWPMLLNEYVFLFPPFNVNGPCSSLNKYFIFSLNYECPMHLAVYIFSYPF